MDESFHIDKLNPDNYQHWCVLVQGLLLTKNCGDIVESGLIPPVTLDAKIKNDKARGWMLMAIEESCLGELVKYKVAKEMWEKIKETREKCNPWHGMLALNEYATSMKQPDESMSEYWSRKDKLLFKIRGA